MAIAPEVTLEIEAQLLLGKEPAQIARERNNSPTYLTILNIKKRMKKQETKDAVVELVKEDPEVVHNAIEQIKATAKPDKVAALDKVEDGISGLRLLNDDFHKTISKALGKADAIMDSKDLSLEDLVTLTDSLSSAYNRIFNSKGSIVNVNNGNQFSSEQLTMFKGSMRE